MGHEETEPQVAYYESELIIGEADDNNFVHCITPHVVLFIFSALNFITYFDRGAIAGALNAVRRDPRIRGSGNALSDTQSGCIVSGFMIGYICTCPLFAAIGGKVSSTRIILCGMAVWGLACIGTALATSYWMLLLCRVFVGVGEAAFVGFTVTIIDNIAPPTRRTLWIGTFYCMVPVGGAVGMAVSGMASEQAAVAGIAAWRVTFLAQMVAAVPVFALVAMLPSKYEVELTDAEEYIPLHRAAAELALNANYALIVLGYATYCFVSGALTVWVIPLLVQGPTHLRTSEASLLAGVAAASAGLLGALLGGSAVDWLGGSNGERGTVNCQLFNIIMITMSVPLGLTALCMTGAVTFAAAFSMCILALFSITAPVNASILTVVPPPLRPYAVSYAVFVIHLLGDFPSPTLAGVLSDHFSRGCPSRDAATCTTDASQRCFWVADAAHKAGQCVHEYQVRNALLAVFTVLIIAIPCWTAVYIRLRRSAAQHEGERQSSTTLLSTPSQ